MEFLQILLYVLGAIFLVATIVLIIKLIMSVDRLNALLDDVEDKMKTVDSLFTVVDKFTDSISLVSDHLVDGIASFIAKIFTSNKKKKNKEDELEEF